MQLYLGKVNEKLQLIKVEAYEKMKRAGQFLQLDDPEIVPVDTVELNLELAGIKVHDKPKEAEVQKGETLERQRKKKKKKGLAAFLEGDKEKEALLKD